MTASRTYLDYNATAPLRPAAREAMLAGLDLVGNPSSVHAEGRRARALIDEARTTIAGLVNAKPAEVVFTSGATEANAWALSGAQQGRWTRVLASATEHESVRASLATLPAEVRGELPVSAEGVVLRDGLASRIPAGALVALQMANNETGVIQPVAELASLGAEAGFSVHTDAVQAAGRVPLDFRALGVATMSLSAHKLGGPKGIGALVIREDVKLGALIPGGGQERRRRGGTENVAAIAGFAAAAREAAAELATIERVRSLRDRLEAEVVRLTPAAHILGKAALRLPNTSAIALPGHAAETLVIKLDLAGIAVSAGAACSSGKVSESHVLAAMGLAPEIARAAIRVSIGAATSDDDIDAFLAAWHRLAGETRIAA